MSNRTCSTGDGKPVKGRGWCLAHYKRWLKYGDPLGFPESPPMPDLAGERWLPAVTWEGLYDVSDLGRVKSLPRIACNGRHVRGCILTPTWSSQDGRGNGYLGVKLCRDGVGVTVLVHRLVGDAFLGSLPDGKETRHLNGDALDNRLVNLVYGTSDENGADMVRHGNSNYGTRNPRVKLTDADVIEIRRRHATGELQRSLAVSFGVGQALVSMIVNGKIWRHLPTVTPPPDGLLF